MTMVNATTEKDAEDLENTKFLVEHLSNSTPPSKEITGIASRINDRRHAFFNAQRGELFDQLESIGIECEKEVGSAVSGLHDSIAATEMRIEELLQQHDPRNLDSSTVLTLSAFSNATIIIDDELAKRWERIVSVRNNVESTEMCRKEKISAIFDQFLPKMMVNSHLLAPDVSRIMEQELLAINQVLLRSKRVYAGFFERLLVDAVVKAKQGQEMLKLYRSEWKEVKIRQAFSDAKTRLEVCCNLRDTDVDGIVEEVLEQQRPLLWTRAAILAEPETMTPPEVTVAGCRDWLRRAQEVTRDLYDAALEGIQEVRQLGESLHLSFFDEVKETSKALQIDLDSSSEDVVWKFQGPCMHASAEKQAQLESDLQFYTLEIGRQRDQELASLRALFAFLHGAAWNWELHLTSLAKAEDFLDANLNKQRMAVQQHVEAKAVKYKSILESLRHGWTTAATNTQLHAAATLAIDLDHQVRDVWRKIMTIFDAYPALVRLLGKGYRQRMCAYMQVTLDKAHLLALPNAAALESALNSMMSHRANLPQLHTQIPTSQPGELHSDSNRPPSEQHPNRLPDIAIEEDEKCQLVELGLTTTEVENLAIRLKSIPAFEEDSRLAPPAAALYTKKGLILLPHPTDLSSCFRFASGKDATNAHDGPASSHDPNPPAPPPLAETESQIAMTANLSFDPPRQFGLVDLSALINVLPDFCNSKNLISEIQTTLRTKFLTHVVDEWGGILIRNSDGLMENKKEALELEIQMQLRCLTLRTSGFIEVVAKQRATEVAEHEERFQAVEAVVTQTIADWKNVGPGAINKAINERLIVTRDNMVLLEKGLVNCSRQSQIDAIKTRIKEETYRYNAYVKKLVVDFRGKVHLKQQDVVQQVRDAVTAMKKFTDGGTYNPDEVKHYEQLYAKFIDRLAGAEKAVLEEARLIEGKRKSVMDTFVNKVTEKVPAHEADVAAVQTLTGLLARAQTSIKTQAALINVGYGNAKQALDRIRDEMNVMEKHLVSSKVVTENTLVALLDLVQELRASCNQLGCLTPLRTVVSPSNSISTNASRDISLSDPPQSRLSVTGSTHLQDSQSNSIVPQDSSTGQEVQRSSLQSTRQSTGFQSSSPGKRPKAEAAKEIPTDFQLNTVDGPVALVAPRVPAPVDPAAGASAPGAPSPTDGEPGRTGRGSVTSNANKPVKRKQKRLERCLVFGEAPLPDPRTFLGIIHAVCWNTINDGLNFAEEYHRLRGSRAITRPGLIPETFETTADKLSQKMLNYLTQSEQFALVLMHKFRDLSNSIMDLTVKLVPYLLRRLLVAYREEVALKQRLVKDRFELDSKRVCDLRQDVKDIISDEAMLRENDVDAMLLTISQGLVAEWINALSGLTVQFLRQLNDASEKLFAICDLIPIPDEMRVPPTPPTVTIRAQSRLSNATSPSLDETHRSGPGQIWRALIVDGLEHVNPEEVGARDVQCTRTTMAHLAVEDGRHRVFNEFIAYYGKLLDYVKAFEISPRIVSDDKGLEAFIHLQLKRLLVLNKMT